MIKSLDLLRRRYHLFIWISPVCNDGQIIGYTYEGEFALRDNNTFSDMDYNSHEYYDKCKRSAIDHAFSHAKQQRYNLKECPTCFKGRCTCFDPF